MPTRTRRLAPAFLVAAALSLSSSMALAGPATETVKTKQIALAELLRAPKTDGAKVVAVLDAVLDYDAIAQASLGAEWANRSDAERAQFSELLRQLVRRAYERNIRKTLAYDIEYTSEDAVDGGVMVKTRATSRGDARQEPLEIDYRLAEVQGTWRTRDIVTEGVSLVGSYRSQFTKIIKKDGFAALIKKMKDKLAKGDG